MIRALSHHHEEEDNNMGDITVSTAEAEVLKRQHIKHEMLDYKFYLSKQEWLEEKIARLDYKLSGAVSAAPVGGHRFRIFHQGQLDNCRARRTRRTAGGKEKL